MVRPHKQPQSQRDGTPHFPGPRICGEPYAAVIISSYSTMTSCGIRYRIAQFASRMMDANVKQRCGAVYLSPTSR